MTTLDRPPYTPAQPQPIQPQLKDEGFSGRCNCGWNGYVRSAYDLAQLDVLRHLERDHQ